MMMLTNLLNMTQYMSQNQIERRKKILLLTFLVFAALC